MVDKDKISENQVALQAAVQTGGIIIAVVVFLLTLQHEEISAVGNQLVLALSGGTITCLFASATYYLKGSNPQQESDKSAEELNIMGDAFFTAGLLCLFAVPPLLFAIKNCFLASAVTLFFLIVIWNSLFSSGVGFFGIRLIASMCINKIWRLFNKKKAKEIVKIRDDAFKESQKSIRESMGNAAIEVLFLGSLFLAFLFSTLFWLGLLKSVF